MGLIDNKSALVQAMAWRRKGDKALLGPMVTQFIGAYMRHLGEMKPKLDYLNSPYVYVWVIMVTPVCLYGVAV